MFQNSDRKFDKHMYERQTFELNDFDIMTKEVGNIISNLNNSKGTYFLFRTKNFKTYFRYTESSFN
jgi:hypothetical protein